MPSSARPIGACSKITSSSATVDCRRVRSTAIQTATAEPNTTVASRTRSCAALMSVWTASMTPPSTLAITATAAVARGVAASAASSGPSTYSGTIVVLSSVTASIAKSTATSSAARKGTPKAQGPCLSRSPRGGEAEDSGLTVRRGLTP